jgi:hypothetical protein
MFGRFNTYFAILDMAKQVREPEEPYPYLHSICQHRFEASHSGDTAEYRQSLDNYISCMTEEIEKAKKSKSKTPVWKGSESDG